MKPLILAVCLAGSLPVPLPSQHAGEEHLPAGSEEGLGQAHMQTSCAPTASADFDRALALFTISGMHVPWSALIGLRRSILSAP